MAASYNPEASKTARLTRINSRYRDRGGLFVPSEKNVLMDVLLSRQVTGASPIKAKATPRRKSRAPTADPEPHVQPRTTAAGSKTPRTKATPKEKGVAIVKTKGATQTPRVRKTEGKAAASAAKKERTRKDGDEHSKATAVKKVSRNKTKVAEDQAASAETSTAIVPTTTKDSKGPTRKRAHAVLPQADDKLQDTAEGSPSKKPKTTTTKVAKPRASRSTATRAKDAAAKGKTKATPNSTVPEVQGDETDPKATTTTMIATSRVAKPKAVQSMNSLRAMMEESDDEEPMPPKRTAPVNAVRSSAKPPSGDDDDDGAPIQPKTKAKRTRKGKEKASDTIQDEAPVNVPDLLPKTKISVDRTNRSAKPDESRRKVKGKEPAVEALPLANHDPDPGEGEEPPNTENTKSKKKKVPEGKEKKPVAKKRAREDEGKTGDRASEPTTTRKRARKDTKVDKREALLETTAPSNEAADQDHDQEEPPAARKGVGKEKAENELKAKGLAAAARKRAREDNPDGEPTTKRKRTRKENKAGVAATVEEAEAAAVKAAPRTRATRKPSVETHAKATRKRGTRKSPTKTKAKASSRSNAKSTSKSPSFPTRHGSPLHAGSDADELDFLS